MDIIIGIALFGCGYLFCDFRAEQQKKELLKTSNRIFELHSYVILGQLGEMHDLGLKALSLAYEKCLEIDQTKQKEYEEFINVFDRKMEEFGDLYLNNLKKALNHKIQFNTYKQVKENFKSLIIDNNKSEDNKDA